MRSEKLTENNEQLAISNKKRNCTDCLHCKVCAMTYINTRICFCSKEKNKQYDLETFWITKKVCKKFEDISA